MSWTLAALLAFAPPSQHDGKPWADASPEAAAERYGAIADAIDTACDVTPEKPRRECTSLLVALAVGESGLARDADEGPCVRTGGYRTRCDSGRAASVFQLQRWAQDPATGKPYTLERLFADRQLAASLALRAARGSLGRCKKLPAEDRLAALGGSCKPNASARARYRLWRTVAAWTPKGER